MGMGFANLEYLAEKRLLERSACILDIGSQNLYGMTPEGIVAFIRQFGRPIDDAALKQISERLSYFSTPRPRERTAFLSDLIKLTDLEYVAYDVCKAPDTEIFDLNIQRLPAIRRNTFDVVLNFGTTEHVINQLNAFEVMHDAMKVGGICFHQLPSIGYVDHGYVNYNPLFIDDLVAANDYEVVDRFYTDAGSGPFASAGVDIRDATKPTVRNSAAGPDRLPNLNLNYIVRKKVDAPFYVGLEVATAHAKLSWTSTMIYGKRRRIAAGDAIRAQATKIVESSSPSWSSRLGRLF